MMLLLSIIHIPTLDLLFVILIRLNAGCTAVVVLKHRDELYCANAGG